MYSKFTQGDIVVFQNEDSEMTWKVIRVEDIKVHLTGPGPCRSVVWAYPNEIQLAKEQKNVQNPQEDQ